MCLSKDRRKPGILVVALSSKRANTSSASRARRRGPVAQHLIDSAGPFCSARRCQLLDACCRRSLASPHDGFDSEKPCVLGDEISVDNGQLIDAREKSPPFRGGDSLVLDLREHQPAVIPAPCAGRVSHNSVLRLVKALGTEGIAPRKTA